MLYPIYRHWDYWRYSNAPEGKKPFEKVMGLSKYGFCVGLAVGTYDCIFLSNTYTFWKSVNCLSYWTLPFTAMCATFASVAYTTTNLRGKDGYANYIAASLATTGVFYHWQKNGKLALSYGASLMLFAMIKKFGDMENFKPIEFDNAFASVTPQYASIPIDWTLVKDPRGPRPWE